MTHQNPSREILQQRADWAEAALLSAKLEIDDLKRFQEQLIAVGKKAQLRDQEEITRLDTELAALKAKQPEASKDSPVWIDGAITPPKVGSVVRYRPKNSSSSETYACEVLNPGNFAHRFYYTLEDSPRPFVAPEPPMPEVTP